MLWLEDGGTTACTDARSRCAPAERFRLELGATVEVDLSREVRTTRSAPCSLAVSTLFASADFSLLVLEGDHHGLHRTYTARP